MEIMEERLKFFRDKIATGQVAARAPSFLEFKMCRVPAFFGVRDPIVSRRRVEDMENV